ncbi:uncharacterized protein LOC144199827 [Stigmatopora nigra]
MRTWTPVLLLLLAVEMAACLGTDGVSGGTTQTTGQLGTTDAGTAADRVTTTNVWTSVNATTHVRTTIGDGTSANSANGTGANATTPGVTTSKAVPPKGGGVPGWGIALLVLAAVLLALLLLMLMAMMSWCCCCNGGRLKHPDDIPLYITHSRLWKGNSTPAYENATAPE